MHWINSTNQKVQYKAFSTTWQSMGVLNFICKPTNLSCLCLHSATGAKSSKTLRNLTAITDPALQRNEICLLCELWWELGVISASHWTTVNPEVMMTKAKLGLEQDLHVSTLSKEDHRDLTDRAIFAVCSLSLLFLYFSGRQQIDSWMKTAEG